MPFSERVHPSEHPLVRHNVGLLRDATTDPVGFRTLIGEVSTLLGYEATRDLRLQEMEVATPLARAAAHRLTDRVGLFPILRAGLGMVDGLWRLVPDAPVWHIGLYRDHRTLQPVQYYNALPPTPDVQVCLVLDPMLATGGSAVATVSILKDWGATRIKFVGVIAAPEGIRALTTAHPDVDIHVAAIDDHLTPPPAHPRDPPEGYIVPGLGDAGDRQFGTG